MTPEPAPSYRAPLAVPSLPRILDIGLFTIRQRRTDPAWLGRAIAVSASLNFSGYPVGSALSGALVDRSLDLAILVGVAACVLAAFLAWWQIPAGAEESPLAA